MKTDTLEYGTGQGLKVGEKTNTISEVFTCVLPLIM